MKLIKITLLILAITNIFWNILLYLNPDKHTSANYLFNVAYAALHLFSVGVALLGVKKFGSKTDLGKGLMFYAIGLSFYTLGLFTWAYYNLILKIEVPYPSLADLFWLLFYPGSAIGFIFIIKSYSSKITSRLIIEFFVVWGVLFGILYSFLNQGGTNESLPFLEGTLNIAYPLFDTFSVAIAITALRSQGGMLHPNLLFFAFASLFMATGDTLFSYRTSQEIYWNGDISDTFLMIDGILFGIGLIGVLAQSVTNPVSKPTTTVSPNT